MDKNDNWKRVGTAEYHHTITEITSCVCKQHANELNQIFQFLLPYLKGNFTGQRIVTGAVFAEFINHSKDDKGLLQQVLNCLLSCLVDPNVKMISIVGLGNIGNAGITEANKYAPTVLDALMSNIDDQNDLIAMEAMNGLSKVFALVEESRVAPTLVNICLRIRPAFEKPHNEIRSASFTLFGSLYRFGSGSAAHVFNEQIHVNLPALVLHVNDDIESVQKACKKALRQLASLYGSDELAAYFKGKIFDEGRVFNYDDFLNELSKILIIAFPDRLNSYVMTCVEFLSKSQWNSIKANATAFCGYLLGNLTPDQRRTINLNPGMAANALILLLKERSPEVRKKAAYALSLLTTY